MKCEDCGCELEHTGAGDGTQGPLDCPDCDAKERDLIAENERLERAEKLNRHTFRLARLGYRLVPLDATHYAVVGRGLREQRLYWSPSERDGGDWVLVPLKNKH